MFDIPTLVYLSTLYTIGSIRSTSLLRRYRDVVETQLTKVRRRHAPVTEIGGSDRRRLISARSQTFNIGVACRYNIGSAYHR